MSEQQGFKIVLKFDHKCAQRMPGHRVCLPIVSVCVPKPKKILLLILPKPRDQFAKVGFAKNKNGQKTSWAHRKSGIYVLFMDEPKYLWGKKTWFRSYGSEIDALQHNRLAIRCIVIICVGGEDRNIFAKFHWSRTHTFCSPFNFREE